MNGFELCPPDGNHLVERHPDLRNSLNLLGRKVELQARATERNCGVSPLGGHSDADVWSAAQTAGRFFVTQDLDFSDARVFAPGTHHGVLLARVPDDEQWRVADHVVAWFSGEAPSHAPISRNTSAADWPSGREPGSG